MAVPRSIRDARYNAKSSKRYALKFNVKTDADLIAKLDSVSSVNGYIRQLIRENIERRGTICKTEKEDTVMNDSQSYTWAKFYALPFAIYDGAKQFWEPGYDYDDPGFWDCYPPENTDPEFIEAVRMYDWLKKNDPDGE